MKKYIRNILVATFALPLLALGMVAVAPTSHAGSPKPTDGQCDKQVNIIEGVDCAKGDKTQETLFEEDADGNSLFKTVTNVLLFLIGAVSVIMLIVGGLRYVLSNGDSSAVTSAKNTILYAVIGIIVALLAYAIVNFVVSSFTASGNGGGNGGRQTTGD